MATPFMGLTLPPVLVTAGPDWATQLNAALTLVDQHNHTPGNGNPVPTAGISVNADFPFNSYSATSLKSVKMANQGVALSGSGNYNSLYVFGNELYYNDSSGNQVKITVGGVVNTGGTGNITGMSGSASATYNSGTSAFSWLATASNFAAMNMASVVLAPTTIAPAVTIQPSASTVSPWTLTLPTAASAAGSPSYPLSSINSSGVMSHVYLDNVGLEFNGTTVRLKDLGVTNAKIAALAVDTAKIAALAVDNSKMASDAITPSKVRYTVDSDYAYIGSTADQTTSGTTKLTVLTMTKTLQKGFVKIILGAVNGGTNSQALLIGVSGDYFQVAIKVSGATANEFIYTFSSVAANQNFPVSLFAMMPVNAGSHTFDATLVRVTGTGTATMRTCSLTIVQI